MAFRDFCFKFYWWLKDTIAPSLQHSQLLYGEVLERLSPKGDNWLDLGCGHRFLPSWSRVNEQELVKDCQNVIGLDYDMPSLAKHETLPFKARADITKLPVADSAFQLVSANMVVEHLNAPEAQFREINRVLKPGGFFLFHTPNIYGYTTQLAMLVPEFIKGTIIRLIEGRTEEDVFPTFYRANSQKHIEAVAERSGFQVEKIRHVTSEAQLITLPLILPFELLWIRLLMTRPLRKLRTNLIVVLKKI